MRREEIEKIMEEAGRQSRGNNHFDIEKVRKLLNTLFLIGGLIGVILYLTTDHLTGIILVGIALLLKMIDYLLRFLF